MEVTLCQRLVFGCIYFDEPATEDGIQSIRSYIERLGYSFSDEDVSEAVEDLISRQLIMVITPELKSSILNSLRGTHGPLYQINDTSHYSVTTSGGNAWLASMREKNPLAGEGFGVDAIKHIQIFTPSEALADELLKSAKFSGYKMRVFNVYLAVNTENIDGYLVDFFETPDVDSHPLTFSRDHDLSFHQELRSTASMELLFANGITLEEAWALICVSGFASPSSAHPVRDTAMQSLSGKGLIRDLQKVELRELKGRLLASQALRFGEVPSSQRSVLTDPGKELIVRVLNVRPELAAHLVVDRIVGVYVHKYFSSYDRAVKTQKTLKESGNAVTEVESIGAWCYYWWDVRREGARFSYWDSYGG